MENIDSVLAVDIGFIQGRSQRFRDVRRVTTETGVLKLQWENRVEGFPLHNISWYVVTKPSKATGTASDKDTPHGKGEKTEVGKNSADLRAENP